jgi:hypothetical protein
MRTTLSLDDDVAIALRRLQQKSQLSWKQVINDALRAGIGALEEGKGRRPRSVRTKSVRLGTPRFDIANLHDVLSLAEGDGRR